MQIVSNGDNLHKMSNHVFSHGNNLYEKSSPVLWEKQEDSSAELAQRVEQVKSGYTILNIRHINLVCKPGDSQNCN